MAANVRGISDPAEASLFNLDAVMAKLSPTKD